MTEGAVEGKRHRRVMTFQAGRPDAAHPVQVHSMTKGTGLLNVSGRIMESAVGPGPFLRVGIIAPVTTLAAAAPRRINAQVEERIVTRATLLTVTGLADRQILLGVRTVLAAVKIAAIQQVK